MAGPAIRTEPVSVLLAEHEPEVAEMSARYLRRDGLRVRLVTTPELALAELTSGPDAVAVLDLTMPGLDARPGPQRRDDRAAAVAGPALRPAATGRPGPRRAGRTCAGAGRGNCRTDRGAAAAGRPESDGPDRGGGRPAGRADRHRARSPGGHAGPSRARNVPAPAARRRWAPGRG